MDVFVIYKMILHPETRQVMKLSTVEYCKSKDEAHKFTRLFELQTPTDLKNKISYRSCAAYME